MDYSKGVRLTAKEVGSDGWKMHSLHGGVVVVIGSQCNTEKGMCKRENVEKVGIKVRVP